MATRDAQMNIYLNTIENAVHGRDMRASLHDAIEKAYNDSYTWYDMTLGNANEALSKATDAITIAQSLGSTVDEIEDLAQELDDKYDSTAARIDNIIAHNNDTEHNTELLDIRTTYQGYIAGAAGTAVRLQAQQLASRINALVREQSTAAVQLPTSPVYTLKWENDSPTSAFAGDTLALAQDTGTCGLYIVFKESNGLGAGEVYANVFFPDPSSTNSVIVRMVKVGSHGIDVCERTVSATRNMYGLSVIISDCTVTSPDNPFSITDSDMTIADPSASQATANNYLIPYQVYYASYVLNGNITVDKDSEITDARIGIDGTVYESLGEAIRTQISNYMAEGILDALNDNY